MLKIQKIYGLEVLDSCGNPTVCAQVQLSSGTAAAAAVPSGACAGETETCGPHCREKDVLHAVENIEHEISPALEKLRGLRPSVIDRTMIELDGTEDKSRLGAGVMLAVSVACARALAAEHGMPLYRYLGGECACRLPVPMMHVLSGGVQAENGMDVRDFMIVPSGIGSFPEALRAGCEIYHALGGLLKEKGLACGVDGRGGFAARLQSDEAALGWLCDAIGRAGFSDVQVQIALDAAASGWQKGGRYRLPKRQTTYGSPELAAYWEGLCGAYPICSLEDPLGKTDHAGWKELTRRLGTRVQVVGDELFASDRRRIAQGTAEQLAGAVLLRPGRLGTLTEIFLAAEEAKKAGWTVILSHGSGETEDTAAADLAVALGAERIKAGAPCRSEHCAKYNRLLQIGRQTAF